MNKSTVIKMCSNILTCKITSNYPSWEPKTSGWPAWQR